jgi:hypothetical protein
LAEFSSKLEASNGSVAFGSIANNLSKVVSNFSRFLIFNEGFLIPQFFPVPLPLFALLISFELMFFWFVEVAAIAELQSLTFHQVQ